MARPGELVVKVLDHLNMEVPDGYRGYGHYLVDPEGRIHAGPFRTRALAEEHLEDLWHLPRTG